MWQCPKCNGHHLNVMVTTCAKLLQYEDNFETEVEGDHEWDDTSNMTCEDCGHCDAALHFDTDQDEPTPEKEPQP
jgi:hypothetical protein